MSLLTHVALRMITQNGLENCKSIYTECISTDLKTINAAFLNDIEGNVKQTKRRSRKERLNRNKRDEKGEIVLQTESSEAKAEAKAEAKTETKLESKKDDKIEASRIYVLCTHSELRKSEDFLKRYVMSAFLMECLKQTDFFDKKDQEILKKGLLSDILLIHVIIKRINLESLILDEAIVVELLIRNLQILQFNAHEIFETVRGSHRSSGSKHNYIAVGIYATGALFNHECYPAVMR